MANSCSVSSCELPARSLGYCNGHYQRFRKDGNVQADVPLRTRVAGRLTLPPNVFWCSTCQTEKSGNEMNSIKYLRRIGKRAGRCKSCADGRDRRLDALRMHGLSQNDYNRLFSEQGGVCAICKKPPKKYLSVDHDHTCCPRRTSCGSCVRGLLCTPCNTKIEWCANYSERVKEYLTIRGNQ